MGLDTTHDCWTGSYASFSRWRDALAEAAGYLILNVKYDDGMVSPCIMLDWGHLPPGHLEGDWGDVVPSDPLHILFTHSDCDGEIKHEHCEMLADAIEKLLPNLEGEPHELLSARDRAVRFIKGLRLAASKGENVKFS